MFDAYIGLNIYCNVFNYYAMMAYSTAVLTLNMVLKSFLSIMQSF